ncbi:MAG: major tail protein, partial [Peptostreptococcaceae bacterium]
LPVISVKKAYIAQRKTGDTYDTPRYLENTTEVSYEKNYGNSTWYAEGTAKFTNSVLKEVPLTLAAGDLTQDDECYMFGHKKSAAGGVIRSALDVAPDVAFIYITESADHKFEVTTLYSGTFTQGGKKAVTSEGQANYQNKQVSAMFKPADFENVKELIDYSQVFETMQAAETYCQNVVIPTVAPAA